MKQHPDTGDVWIGQPTYTQAVIRKFGMENTKPVKTPVTPGAKLEKGTEESVIVDVTTYQFAVSSLLYLSVNNVTRSCSKPTKDHWTAVKSILRS